MITLHLKAGRGTTERGTRDNQVKIIWDWIKNATSGLEKDVLIVGDFNMVPGQDAANFSNLNPKDYLHFVSHSLGGGFTHIKAPGKAGNLLDGYAISKKYTKEYIPNSIRIVPLSDILDKNLYEYRQLTDHLPVEANFRITKDDD